MTITQKNVICKDEHDREYLGERRLQRITEALNKGHSMLRDMSDDELAQVITGDIKTKASDITDEQLKAILKGRGGNESGTPLAKLGT